MTPTERQARIAKAPKWVQDEIARLNRRLREAEDVARAVSETGEADAYLDCYGKFPRPVVPPGHRVRFPLDGLGGRRWIDVRRLGGAIEIMASSGLSVRPSSSNVALLEVVDW